MPERIGHQSRHNIFIASTVLALLLVLSTLVSAAWVSGEAYAAPRNGWNSSHTKYFVDGKAVKGAKKIGKKYYAFDSKGKLATAGKSFTIGSKTYYPTKKGVLRAIKKGKTYYYANGVEMVKADSMDFACLLRAEELVAELTLPTDSKSVKLEKTFRWVMATSYLTGVISYAKKPSGWLPKHAMMVFNDRKGDCISDSVAFAYLAVAIGCNDVYVCANGSKTDPHAWTAIGDRYYDPRFARKDFDAYYNVGQEMYFFSNMSRYCVPYYSMANASSAKKASKKKAVKKNGFVTANGLTYYYKNGKMLKKKWLKIKGKKYYFKGDGRMAVGSFKRGGKYYVTRPNGTLMTGKKTRVVSALGSKYRLDKNGRAVPGWTDDLSKRYLKTGELAKYPRMIGGKLFYFDSSGNFNIEKTLQLRLVMKENATVDDMKALLGNPYRIRTYGESCYTVNDLGGIDRRYEYPRLKVYTMKCEDGQEYIISWE